jgi:hypothetical protein
METIRVVEPRVAIRADVEKNHVILYGGLRVNEVVEPAQSWGSVGSKPVQALFTINPPSTTTIVDRYVRFRGYFEITTDQDLEIGLNDALRQFPIATITDVLNVQINGETITDNTGDKIHALLCYGNTPQDRQESVSVSPSAPDSYQQYADWATYGSAKNPLAKFGENQFDPRGGFPIEVIDARTFRVVITEPIFMSPFLTGLGRQDEGFVNINQMNFNWRWKTNLSQMLSHSSLGNAITTVDVSMYRAPEMLMTYITPDLTMPLPQLQILPYVKQNEYLKTYDAIANGSSQLLMSDSIKLSQIPRKLFLFARHKRSSSTQNTSDSFLRLDRVNVLWNNQSGLLSNASEQQLFEMSKRNGLNLSYPSWRKHRGGVMCIEFGKDIGLLDSEAAGVQGQYTIQVQLDTTNVSGATFDAEFYMVFLYEGTFSVFENGARASLGNLSQEMVLMSKESEEMDYHHYSGMNGGSFWSDLKGFVNKISRGVQTVGKFVAPALSTAFPQYAPVISGVMRGADFAREATGGGYAGGGLSGGKLSRKSMKGRR